jgi:hypothetical protein
MAAKAVEASTIILGRGRPGWLLTQGDPALRDPRDMFRVSDPGGTPAMVAVLVLRNAGRLPGLSR